MASAFPLSEADLHGLVDGRLEAARRADVLRRLATAPADRAKIEAWQDQNELIRHAFLGVEKETLPSTLRLTPPPNLHCVHLAEAALPDEAPAAPRRRGALARVATIVLIAVVAIGTVLVIQFSDTTPTSSRLNATGDEALASRTAAALDSMANRSTAAQTSGPTLPTTTIPDLTPVGFALTDAEVQASNGIVFHYRDAAAELVVVSVARVSARTDDLAVTQIGRSYSWHHGNVAFAIAGTVGADRLRVMATLLQGDAEQ